MIFYISCRPLRIGKRIVSPKECLKYNFIGIKYSFRCLGFNHKIDGRWLYEIELDDSYTTEKTTELQAIFQEALMPFACHLKTLQSAKELAEKINEGVIFDIKKDKIAIKEKK